MDDERKDGGTDFAETAVFFLAPNDQQKLEVNYTRGFFKQNFQIMLDGVCLESGLSEVELKQGKTYPLPDGESIEVKFLGNQVVVWQDGERIPIDHEVDNHQVDPWKNLTLTMYIVGGYSLFAGLVQLFPFSDVDVSSLAFWIDIASMIFLGAVLLVCGYVGRRQQKIWTLWLGNGILFILLIMWFYYTYWLGLYYSRFSRILFIILFFFLAREQVKNTRKVQASLNETTTVNS